MKYSQRNQRDRGGQTQHQPGLQRAGLEAHLHEMFAWANGYSTKRAIDHVHVGGLAIHVGLPGGIRHFAGDQQC
ncbi:MAG: hypothetical protein JO020_22060 [Chloroflexi bacterium]|nr:hypothetical protein [Chloroflexota bacterium]